MKNRMLVLGVVVMVGCMMLLPCLAEGIVPYYTGTQKTACYFSISNGVATCSGEIEPKANYTASVTVKLQKKDGTWGTIATWTGSGTAGKTVTAGGDKSIDSGYEYRVVVSGTVRDANGKVVERPSKTSAVKSY